MEAFLGSMADTLLTALTGADDRVLKGEPAQ